MPKEKILRPYKSEFTDIISKDSVRYLLLIPSLDPAYKFITNPNLLNSIIWFSETAGISWHKGKKIDQKSGLGLHGRLNFRFSGFCTGKSPDINIGHFKGYAT